MSSCPAVYAMCAICGSVGFAACASIIPPVRHTAATIAVNLSLIAVSSPRPGPDGPASGPTVLDLRWIEWEGKGSRLRGGVILLTAASAGKLRLRGGTILDRRFGEASSAFAAMDS